MKQKIFSLICLLTMLSYGFISGLPNQEANIIYFDDFEGSVLKWTQTSYGIVSLTNEASFYGDQSMKILAYPYSNQEALRMVGTPAGSLSVVTLSFYFSSPIQNFNYFCFGLEISSANTDRSYIFSVMFPQNKYLDINDSWSNIEGLNVGWDLSEEYNIWHKAELKANFETGEYLSVSIDNHSVDLKSYGYESFKDKPKYYWDIFYSWFYVGSSSGSCYVLIDDVSLTVG